MDTTILISRRSKKERLKFHRAYVYKKIRKYIKNGCIGGLNLRGEPIEYLPNDLKYVGGYLDLSGSQISSLTSGLQVDGDLYLTTTPITSLPDGLKVGGGLYLAYTKISSLPNELQKVGGNLNLFNTKIKSLPDGLRVGRNLDLSHTEITSLPDGLEIMDNLYLNITPLSRKYTKDQIEQMIIDKGGSINGYIYK